MKKYWIYLLVLILTSLACNINATLPRPTQIIATLASAPPVEIPAVFTSSPTASSIPTFTLIPATGTSTPLPVVESLDALVTADNLSCRYGPGAEYLYFTGLKKGWKLKLLGRTDGNNWVMVQQKNKCWVNAKFIEIKGDKQLLKVVYPNEYKLPKSPNYPAPAGVKATRGGINVTVTWNEMTLPPNDAEDENMLKYIIEVWRCEKEQIIFDPLASNYPEVTFVDEPGCSIPSHGRIFFQEKHGFAGPTEIIPWP